MNRLLAASALALACVTGTAAPASAGVYVCDIVRCPTTCLPNCIPDPVDRCFYVDPYTIVCV